MLARRHPSEIFVYRFVLVEYIKSTFHESIVYFNKKRNTKVLTFTAQGMA